MEKTERALRSPGEESAPLSEAGMRGRNAYNLSLETPGRGPTQEATYCRRERREGGAEDEQLAAHS